jgi:hypothetical protein
LKRARAVPQQHEEDEERSREAHPIENGQELIRLHAYVGDYVGRYLLKGFAMVRLEVVGMREFHFNVKHRLHLIAEPFDLCTEERSIESSTEDSGDSGDNAFTRDG